MRWVVMNPIVLKPNENRTIYCSTTHHHLRFCGPPLIEMMGDGPTAGLRHQGLEEMGSDTDYGQEHQTILSPDRATKMRSCLPNISCDLLARTAYKLTFSLHQVQQRVQSLSCGGKVSSKMILP